MNLHRTTGKPDWDALADGDLNIWQAIGKKSHGIITPANFITVLGFFIVVLGLVFISSHEYLDGAILVACGRGFDVLDGIIAQKTRTKGPVGEAFDVVADKIITLLVILTLFAAQVTAWWILALLLLPQVLNTVITLIKRMRNLTLHPSLIGKLSTAGLWISIAGLILLAALKIQSLNPLSFLVYLISIVSIAAGLFASVEYLTGRSK